MFNFMFSAIAGEIFDLHIFVLGIFHKSQYVAKIIVRQEKLYINKSNK